MGVEVRVMKKADIEAARIKVVDMLNEAGGPEALAQLMNNPPKGFRSAFLEGLGIAPPTDEDLKRTVEPGRLDMHAALKTAAGAQHFYEEVQSLIRQQFENFGEVPPVMYILATLNPRTNDPLDVPAIIALDVRDFLMGRDGDEIRMKKHAMMQMVRLVTWAVAAVGAVFVTEAWMSDVPVEQRDNPNRPQPKDDPNHKEVVMMVCEHYRVDNGNSKMFSAVIRRDEGVAPVLEEFDLRSAEPGSRTGGSTSGFLPPMQ